MSDYIQLGATPADESCVQTTEDGYELKARAECKKFIELLRRKFGPEPKGAMLKVRGFNHDFGRYYECICTYRDQESFDYALRLEEEAPTRWEDFEDTPKPGKKDSDSP